MMAVTVLTISITVQTYRKQNMFTDQILHYASIDATVTQMYTT